MFCISLLLRLYSVSLKTELQSGLYFFSMQEFLCRRFSLTRPPQQDTFFSNGPLLQAGGRRRAFALHYFCFLLFCQSHGYSHCHRKLPGVWSGNRLVLRILARGPVSRSKIWLFGPIQRVTVKRFFISRFCKLLQQCSALPAAPRLRVPVSTKSVFSWYRFCFLCLHEFFMTRETTVVSHFVFSFSQGSYI